MSIWTLLFVLAFVGMMVMHLRGHGHGGGHGHGRGDVRGDDAEAHYGDTSRSDALTAEQSAGANEARGGHTGHRHGC